MIAKAIYQKKFNMPGTPVVLQLSHVWIYAEYS